MTFYYVPTVVEVDGVECPTTLWWNVGVEWADGNKWIHLTITRYWPFLRISMA